MLILSRKVDEKIMIGDDIVITVIEFPHSGNVRLGIEAPKDMPVHREEVYLRIHGKDEKK